MCLPVSWCAPSSPAFSTSAFWLRSPGCVWRACSCTSCWLRCLRVNSRAGSTTTSLGTSSQLWWWASQQPSTTGATAHSGRKCGIFLQRLFFRGIKIRSISSPISPPRRTPTACMYVLMSNITKSSPPLPPGKFTPCHC